MIHPALWQLLRMRVFGFFRRIFQSGRTMRGALTMMFCLGFFALIVCSGVSSAVSINSDVRAQMIARPVAELIPAGMLALFLFSVLTSAGERAIYFSPSEIDFLFSGPFTRRELLIYKLSSTIAGALFTSLLLSVSCTLFLPWWFAGVVGVFLSVMFIHGVSLNISLLGQIVAEHAFTRVRRIIGGVILIAVIIGLAQALAHVHAQGFMQTLRAFQATPAGMIVLSPFQIFAKTVTATTWSELGLWCAVAFVVDIVLFVLAVRLDANYLESAVRVSQQVAQRLRQARRGGGALTKLPSESSWSLPMLPRLAGTGVITWAQLGKLIRSSRGMMLMALALVVAVGIGIAASNRQLATGAMVPGVAIGAMAYLTFLVSMNSPLGFRSDVDQIEWLKMLPLQPLAIAWGEVLAAVMLTSTLQITVFMIVGAFTNSVVIMLWASAFAVPFSLLMFGLDNLIFLLYPSRAAPSAPGDIQFMGRFFVQTLLKMLVLFALLIPTAILGLIGWLATQNIHAIPAVALVSVLITDLGLMYSVSWAFRRYDPSSDTPA